MNADLGQDDERQHGEHANVPASTMPAQVMTAPVTASPRSMPSACRA